MTISVIQAANADNPTNVSFTANVTAGNSVILLASAYNSNGLTMISSAPTYNGNIVTGAVKLVDQQSPFSGFAAYGAIWLLPDLAGGAKGPFAITFVNNTGVSEYQVLEVSGLGASPVTGPSSAGNGSSSSASSGAAAALTGSALVVGFGTANNNVFSNPPQTSPWTAFFLDTGFDASGYQVASSGTLSWIPAMTTSAQWAAMIGSVYGPSAPAAVYLVTGGFSRRRTKAGTRAFWRGGVGSAAIVVVTPVPVVGGTVRRRSGARAVWRSGRGTLGPQPKAVAGGFLRNRTGPGPRAFWRRGAGTLGPQPQAAVGGLVRRRLTARAVWRGIAGTVAPTVAPSRAVVGGFLRTRVGTRAVWRGIAGTAEAIAPARYVTGGFYRRRPVPRAVWRGGSGTVGVTVALGVATTGGLVRRRTAARAVWRGYGEAAGFRAAVVGGLVRNRAVSRAVWRGRAVPPVIGVPVVGGIAPHRSHPRVVWRGGTGVLGPQPQARTGGLVRRRSGTRVEWHGQRGSQAPPPPNGTVPRRIEVMRRPGVRAVWRGAVPVGANSTVVSGPALEIALGQPYWDWETGPVGFDWGTGQPGLAWGTGPVGIG